MTQAQAAAAPPADLINMNVLEQRIALHKAEIVKRLEDIKSLNENLETARLDIVGRAGAIQDLQELCKLISADPAQKR